MQPDGDVHYEISSYVLGCECPICGRTCAPSTLVVRRGTQRQLLLYACLPCLDLVTHLIHLERFLTIQCRYAAAR